MIEVKKSEFVFVQLGEFDDPSYVYLMDGKMYGCINYDGIWRGTLREDCQYSVGVFEEMAMKINELNDSLIEQRKEFFGLF